MRFIDTMTPAEIDTLQLKGLLPDTDYELSRTESACAWFDSLPPWACVICGKDAETCEHYESNTD